MIQKNLIKILLLIFLIICYSYLNFAADSFTLPELLKGLENHNLLLEISRIETHIAKQEYREIRALPNPQIELFKGEGEIQSGTTTDRPAVWGMSLRLPVPNPFYRFYFLKSQRSHINAARIAADIKKQELVRELKEHFYSVQFSNKIAGLLAQKISRLEEVYRITKAKASIGEAKEIDFLRASVEIQENRSALFKMEKIAASEKTKINELLNNTLNRDFDIVADFDFTPLGAIEEQVAGLLEKSPLLVLKRNDLDEKNAGLQAGRWALLESVEVFGEREKEIDAKVWRFGLGLSLPVFNWNSAHLKKVKYEQTKAQKEFEHARKHLLADIDRMITAIRVLEKEIDTFTSAVLEAGRENLEISEKLYKEGEIPLVVFLDSQDSYFELEQRYYASICEWKTAKAALEELLALELQ